jgi:hypothetical protein
MQSAERLLSDLHLRFKPHSTLIPLRQITAHSWITIFHGTGVEPSPLTLRPFIGLLYQTWMTDGDDCGAISGMKERQWKPKY